MADPRAKYFSRLRRLRGSARRWSVISGALICAAVVLLPYQGIGMPDVLWAAAAGGATALTWWRWSDFRVLAAQDAPPELDPAVRAAHTQMRIESVIGRIPIGRTAIKEMHRVSHLSKLRGSSAAPAGARLDRASKALAGLASRLTGPTSDVMLEANLAERALRDLAERIASVERAMKMPPGPDGGSALASAHEDLVSRFTAGVGTYEGLVSAAASYVAEDGRLGEPIAIGRLIEATDRLRGVASGMSDLRATDPTAFS
jgi:hypothetical protein